MIDRNNQRLIDAHNAYWPAESDMIEGNPQLILERREADRSLPPLLSLQGTNDNNLTADMATRLVAAYRAASGDARLEEYADQEHTLVTKYPDAEPSTRAIAEMIAFIHERTGTRMPSRA